MSVLTLQGTGVTDTYLRSDQVDTNYSTETVISVGMATETYRGIVKFDLSSIPAGATINSAVMTIYVFGDISSNARVASVYRIKQTVNISQATWNSFATGSSWATAGCSHTTTDRESTDISDGPTVPASPSAGDPIVFTLTASKIQEITSGAFTNNGFLIKVATEDTDMMQYDSTESLTAGEKPKLVVTYTLASGGSFLETML
jgi:hypothetical protein